MAGTERGRGVVLMAYSEFGRRVAANANEGTDHGTAGPVFVAGAPGRGGFVGAQPSLTDLDNGDLKPTTDFRDVYATMLAGRAGRRPGPGPGSRPHDPAAARGLISSSAALPTSQECHAAATGTEECHRNVTLLRLSRRSVTLLRVGAAGRWAG